MMCTNEELNGLIDKENLNLEMFVELIKNSISEKAKQDAQIIKEKE